MLPLNWYDTDKIAEVSASEWGSSEAIEAVGMTSSPDFLPQNRAMSALMHGAQLGLIFPQNTGGTKATGTLDDLTITAKKFGIAGNEITINIIERNNTYVVTTFFRGMSQGFQVITTLEDLSENPFVDFSFEIDNTDPEEPIVPSVPLGEVMLEGGTNGTIPDWTTRMQAFMDAAALEFWHTIAFNMSPTDTGFITAKAAFVDWLKELNREEQQIRQAVIFNNTEVSDDTEMIININQTAEFDGTRLTPAEMTLYRTGMTAGTAINVSETASNMGRIANIEPRYPKRQRENFINLGFFIYHQDQDGVISVVRDINSFVSTEPKKNIQWTDNRTIRTLNDMMIQIALEFTRGYMGKVDDNEHGRDMFHTSIHVLFLTYQDISALQNHDINKIIVEPGGFRTWKITANDTQIVTAVDTLDFLMFITW